MRIAELVLGALAAYSAMGLIFAIPFVAFGVLRVDPAARGSKWGFRVLILPGVVAFWPVMLAKWFRSAKSGDGGRA